VRTPFEIDADELRRDLLKHAGQPLTPAHAAAEGAVDEHGSSADDAVTEIQEEASRGPGIREGVAESSKAFRDAYSVPAEYPQPVQVSPEAFREGPVSAGHQADSPGWQPPSQGPPPRPTAPWAYLGQPSAHSPDMSGDCA
jgi:hypothetical protein